MLIYCIANRMFCPSCQLRIHGDVHSATRRVRRSGASFSSMTTTTGIGESTKDQRPLLWLVLLRTTQRHTVWNLTKNCHYSSLISLTCLYIFNAYRLLYLHRGKRLGARRPRSSAFWLLRYKLVFLCQLSHIQLFSTRSPHRSTRAVRPTQCPQIPACRM